MSRDEHPAGRGRFQGVEGEDLTDAEWEAFVEAIRRPEPAWLVREDGLHVYDQGDRNPAAAIFVVLAIDAVLFAVGYAIWRLVIR